MSEYLHDAVVRFRAAADAAVERGHRAAADARDSGAAFDRETRRVTDRLRRGDLDPQPERFTSADLSTAATEYRQAQGLPVPDLTVEPETEAGPAPGDDDDYFADHRIMRKV